MPAPLQNQVDLVPLRTSRLQLAALVAALAGLLPLGTWATAGAGAATTSAANLLSGDTATLAASVGAWAGRNATVSRPTSGVLAISAASTEWAGAVSGSGSAAAPAEPGRVYTGTVSVRSARTARSVRPILQFLGADGSVLERATGQVVTDVSSTWTDAQPVVGLAPAGTVAVALAELVASPAWGEVHYLRSPVVTVAPSVSRDVVGPLSTSGNQVVGANGPVLLRGIHRLGMESVGFPAITSGEVAQLKRWGATMVRVSVASPYWLSSSCSAVSGYVAAVDRVVSAITAQKMVALVDLHENSVVACGGVKPQKMADSTALDFWRQVAARYRSNPLVAFDLYNEPHDISDDVWFRGGRIVAGNGVTYTAVGMQQMYDAVRSTGADNLVVVSGNDWANRLPRQLSDAVNVVYGVHVYTCPTSTDPATCTPNPLDPSPTLNNYTSVASTAPVVISEFGWPSAGDGRYATNVIRYARDHGWGWIAFAWDGGNTGDFSLLATLNSTYEPSPAGMPVLAGLNAP